MLPAKPRPETLRLSPLSLGTSTFGREVDETRAGRILDHAVRRGIKHIDTAANYSRGLSESIVGRWLSRCRPALPSLTVASKIYPPYTPDALGPAVNASLQRLRVPAIDLLYLHKWDDAVASPDSLIALDQLREQGLVQTLGVSNFTAPQLASVLSLQDRLGLAPVRAIQNNNNLAVRHVDDALRRICAERRIAIITYSPLGAGFLTGKHTDGVQAGSRFDIAPGHQDVYFNDRSRQRLARLRKLSDQSGEPMHRLALAWALHAPGVDSVLVGARKEEHIDQAIDALALSDEPILADLRAI